MEPSFFNQLKVEIVKREKELEILRAAYNALSGVQASSSTVGEAAASFPKPNGGRTRKQELSDFLRLHGPSARKDILMRTKIPSGTVDAALSDKEIFARDESGKWTVKENS